MKLLRACALLLAIVCTAHAADGIIQFPVNGQAPDTGTELRLLLESILFLF
jgi:hypothetical protein